MKRLTLRHCRRLVIAALLITCAALPHLLYQPPAQASGRTPRPSCNDNPKAGTAVLSPNGTANAMTLVTFDTPFCTSPVIVVATISNQSTAGERVGSQAFGLDTAAISLQLDEPSEIGYEVNWMAMRASQ
jgi:hypothetical protein